MNCSKCGTQIENGASVCTNCGAPITSDESKIEKEEFTFCKKKQIGTLTYKKTTTEVIISESTAEIKQTVKKVLRRQKTVNSLIMLDEITDVRINTKFDFWDTLYAVLFAVIGFVSPIAFIATAVCLFCAYGKEITITTSKAKISIPFGALGSSSEAAKFVSTCRS